MFLRTSAFEVMSPQLPSLSLSGVVVSQPRFPLKGDVRPGGASAFVELIRKTNSMSILVFNAHSAKENTTRLQLTVFVSVSTAPVSKTTLKNSGAVTINVQLVSCSILVTTLWFCTITLPASLTIKKN